MNRFRRMITLLALAGVLAAGAIAAAAGDDRAGTEALLKEVEASPKKDVAGEYLTRSKAALDRAARLRAAGDESHARIADAMARKWAEAARDVVRAAVVEENAANARRGAADAGVLADRERALLEESIAQSGRLRAQIESTERDGKEQPARTSTAASAISSSKPAPKAAPAPAPAPGPGPAGPAGPAGAKDGGTK